MKANTGLAARVIRVARVNAFIGRDLVGRDGRGNEAFDWRIGGLFQAAYRGMSRTLCVLCAGLPAKGAQRPR
ncbi:hypothetical protein PPUJ20066_51930 [Pseudomonas putida]|nr:hypothetical protein PPUJ20066_51930 [Pseudomonas putida]